ncbi:hypothetical protein [Pseudomonas sp. TTU2014-080ASC]|nr:hypothetical protein [Pseudomonas sp. TTU2014-080ASC]
MLHPAMEQVAAVADCVGDRAGFSALGWLFESGWCLGDAVE